MENHLVITRKFFVVFLLIGLTFIVSCKDKEEVAEKEPAKWFVELGFKKQMKQMKKDTSLLARRLGELDWDEATKLFNIIEKSFKSLDLESSLLPEDFPEFKDAFDKSLERLRLASREKDSDMVETRLEMFRKACHHCHLRYRKELDALNTETDFGVALERVYKKDSTSK